MLDAEARSLTVVDGAEDLARSTEAQARKVVHSSSDTKDLAVSRVSLAIEWVLYRSCGLTMPRASSLPVDGGFIGPREDEL